MASISITYTPNYLGCHRIYFREDGNPEYCLYVDDSASVIGEPKTTEIILAGEYEGCITIPEGVACNNIPVEGYIQPCCAAEADEESKVPFDFNIDADTCDSYAVSCQSSGIAFIFMTDAGEGYTSTPSVVILNAAGGTGFAYTVNMDGSIVDSVTVTNSGKNYSPGSTVLFVGGDPIRPASANIEFCPCGTNCAVSSEVYVSNCIDQEQETLVPPAAGQSYVVCSNTIPVAVDAPNLSIAKAFTTCCTCNSYRISNQDKARSLPIHYIDCNNIYQTATIDALGVLVICAVTNSVGFVKDYPSTMINLGSCS